MVDPAQPNYSCLSCSKPVRSVACLLACYRSGRPACLPRGRVGAGTDPFSAEGKPSCTATRLRIEEVAYATTCLFFLLAYSFRKVVFFTIRIIFMLWIIIVWRNVSSSGNCFVAKSYTYELNPIFIVDDYQTLSPRAFLLFCTVRATN